MEIELRKFDINDINDDKVVVLIGKRETGKSFLVKDLLYYHQDIPVGTVISGTEGANAFYSSIMPSIFIHCDGVKILKSIFILFSVSLFGSTSFYTPCCLSPSLWVLFCRWSIWYWRVGTPLHWR